MKLASALKVGHINQTEVFLRQPIRKLIYGHCQAILELSATCTIKQYQEQL
jgi:hypothetical protein